LSLSVAGVGSLNLYRNIFHIHLITIFIHSSTIYSSSLNTKKQQITQKFIVLPPLPWDPDKLKTQKQLLYTYVNHSVAFAFILMKPTKIKGSYSARISRFCCLRPLPHETRHAQRQQMRLGIKILMPPPSI